MLQKEELKVRQKFVHRLLGVVIFSRDCRLMEQCCPRPDTLYVEQEGEVVQVLLKDLQTRG